MVKPLDLSQYPFLLLRPEEEKPVEMAFKDKGKRYLDLDKYQAISLLAKKETREVKLASSKKFAPSLVSKPKKQQPLKLSSQNLEVLFDKYSQQYQVASGLLKKIARCESSFNPRAVNGPYGGMFQFLASTWQSNRRAMGLDPNPSLRFNPEEAIKTTAFKISRDGTGAWPVCGR